MVFNRWAQYQRAKRIYEMTSNEGEGKAVLAEQWKSPTMRGRPFTVTP